MPQDQIPGLITHSYDDTAVLETLQPGANVYGPPVTVDGSVVVADLSAPYRLPKGTVIVQSTTAGKYVKAGAAASGTPESGTAPAVTSEEAADSDWASKVITLYVDGVQKAQVTLGGADDTTAEVVTALNGDTEFAKYALASGSNGNPLVITGNRAGAGHSLRVSMNLSTAWATDLTTSSETEDHGTDPDYRVTYTDADLYDEQHSAIDPPVQNLLRGVFDASELTGLTSEARAVFERRGSIFL